MTEIGNCFHKYCLQCISVLLTSLSADERSIKCNAEKCETQICNRKLKEFAMTPMVKQKEVICKLDVNPCIFLLSGYMFLYFPLNCCSSSIFKAQNTIENRYQIFTAIQLPFIFGITAHISKKKLNITYL